jgi:hypothetical protein
MREMLRQKNEEIFALRKLLGMHGTQDEETWGLHAPQDVRDQMAASAYIAEKLNPYHALLRLGFPVEPMASRPRGPKEKAALQETLELAGRIFGTPGVKKILEDDARSVEENRHELQKRLVQIGRHGDDGESVRAIQQLSRMLPGWLAGDKEVAAAGAASIDNRKMNLFLMAGHGREMAGDDAEALANPDRIVDAADLLSHEPGEAVEIPDTDDEHLARR